MKDTLKFASKLFMCVLISCLLSFVVVIFVGMDSPELTVVDADNKIVEYVGTSISFLGNLTSAVCTLFLCVMVYHYSWDTAFKDYNKVFTAPTKHYLLKGLVSGFIAIIPVMIIGLLSLLKVSVYLDYVYRILMAPFIYWYNAFYRSGQYIFSFCLVLVVPIVSTVAYLLGRKGIFPLKTLIYDKKSFVSQNDNSPNGTEILDDRNRNNLK